MASLNAISPDKLARLIGTPNCPTVIDLRDDARDLIPAAIPKRLDKIGHWAGALSGRDAVVFCEDGHAQSAAAAAMLRTAGCAAELLEGGFRAWQAAALLTLEAAKLPARDAEGRTMWVTRARPKVDRVACPWLIRRFIDAEARILYVAPPEVLGVAAQLGAASFDSEGARYCDREGRCSFDEILDEHGLREFPALPQLATIVRGADTAQPDLAPQAAGLLAVSLGLSRMFADDLEQLDAGMLVYDALYRWCRDAGEETHDATSHQPRGASLPRHLCRSRDVERRP